MGKNHRTALASRRLAGFDYSSARAYFVTLCVLDRLPRFGRIQAGELRLSAEGSIVSEEWRRVAVVRPGVELDEFVVMPDHMHAIVLLPALKLPHQSASATTPLFRRPRSLGSLIAQFKATTTRRINARLGVTARRLWQRNYHDRVIRDAAELNRIRRYIALNPIRWVASGNPVCRRGPP